MSTYFIDFQGVVINGETIINELCIIDARHILKPMHYIFKSDAFNSNEFTHKLDCDMFCPTCITCNMSLKNAIFYALNDKIETLKKYFPMIRLNYYNKTIQETIPKYISCPYRDHGIQCSYKNCLTMCIDYCQIS
jgi:hypothetical protein